MTIVVSGSGSDTDPVPTFMPTVAIQQEGTTPVLIFRLDRPLSGALLDGALSSLLLYDLMLRRLGDALDDVVFLKKDLARSMDTVSDAMGLLREHSEQGHPTLW